MELSHHGADAQTIPERVTAEQPVLSAHLDQSVAHQAQTSALIREKVSELLLRSELVGEPHPGWPRLHLGGMEEDLRDRKSKKALLAFEIERGKIVPELWLVREPARLIDQVLQYDQLFRMPVRGRRRVRQLGDPRDDLFDTGSNAALQLGCEPLLVASEEPITELRIRDSRSRWRPPDLTLET